MPSHREIAMIFLRLAASGNVREAYAKYVDPTFHHHNAYFPGDRESLLRAMEENTKSNPNKTFEVKMSLEDGSLVACYSRVQQKTPEGERGIAVVHILRFKDDKIVEMWDVGQVIPPDSPNKNGMF